MLIAMLTLQAHLDKMGRIATLDEAALDQVRALGRITARTDVTVPSKPKDYLAAWRARRAARKAYKERLAVVEAEFKKAYKAEKAFLEGAIRNAPPPPPEPASASAA